MIRITNPEGFISQGVMNWELHACKKYWEKEARGDLLRKDISTFSFMSIASRIRLLIPLRMSCTVHSMEKRHSHEKFMMITRAETRVQCEFPPHTLLPGSPVRKKYRANKLS